MIKFDVIELPDKKGGKIKRYTEEREYPEEGKRHSDLCVVCGFSTYPKCREWCQHESGVLKRRVVDTTKIKNDFSSSIEEIEEATIKIY